MADDTKKPTNGHGTNGKIVDLSEVRADVAGVQPTEPPGIDEDKIQIPRSFLFHMRDGSTHLLKGYLIVTPTFISMVRSDWDVQFMAPLSQLDFLEQVAEDEQA